MCPTCVFQAGQMHIDCPGYEEQVGHIKSLFWKDLQSTARVEARISPSESVRHRFRHRFVLGGLFGGTFSSHILCERRKRPSTRAAFYKCPNVKSLVCPTCVFQPGQSNLFCPGYEEQVGQFKSLFWKKLRLLPGLHSAFF